MPIATESPATTPHCGGSAPPARAVTWETLKIVIASTPKTGNTWLKHLLSDIYELPIVELSANYREGASYPRWVGHQHYLPESGLLEWGRQNGVVFVTTVRYPGDVLVSLRHHIKLGEVKPVGDAHDPASMLLDAESTFGEHTRRYVDSGFFLMLHVSICWSQGGWSHVVRYEDLWREPVATLQRLTDVIVPVPGERIQAAVQACELGQMRRRFPAEGKFYRKGGSGGWAVALPGEIRRRFHADPYPAQFAALGYELDGADRLPPETSPFAELRRRLRVLRNLPLIVKIWSALPPARQVRWLDAARGSETCLGWLNLPAAEDERVPTQFPVITKLALGLHQRDPAMAGYYPDPLGRNRVEFTNWFLYFGPTLFGLDGHFILPMLHAWADRSPRQCPQAI